MLKYIDNIFNDSSLKIKLELYILPLLLIYLFINFFMDSSFSNNTNTYNFNKIENKKYSDSYLELSKTIEEFCSRKKIKLVSIKNSKNKLFLKGETSIKKLDSLILKLEYLNNYTNLTKFNISKKSAYIYSFELNISMDNFFVKDKKKHIKKKIVRSSNRLDLTAIISSYVFINKKWLVLGEEINGHKIINIQENFVELSKNSKKIKLWIYKND